MIHHDFQRRIARWTVLAFCVPFLAGCGGQNSSQAQRGPAGSYRTENTSPPQRQGMTGKQKMAMLVGAAALYYVYKTYKAQHQNAPENVRQVVPPGVQLYRSRANGGIYYRNPNNPSDVHWLTIPNNRIEVPQQDYNRIMSEQDQWKGMPVPTAGTPVPNGPSSY